MIRQLSLLLLLLQHLCPSSLVHCQCTPSWQTNRDLHAPTDLTGDLVTLQYLVEELQDEADFERQLDAILIPRPVDTENHTRVENHITSHLLGLGYFIELDVFEKETVVGNRTFSNILAHINPDSPRRVVIACHYDSMPTIEGFVGATDSAVPCAMLLNLATTMTDIFVQQNLANPEVSISLVFFDGEEAMRTWTSTDSLYGSTHMANAWLATEYWAPEDQWCQTLTANYIDRMDLLFLLDLIGTPEPQFQRLVLVRNGTYLPNPYYDMMRDIEQTLLVTFPLTTEPMLNGFNSSSLPTDDQTPFLRNGLTRLLYLITRPFPAVWHTIDDNRDCLDFEYIKTLNMLNRVWTAQYLQYQPTSSNAASKLAPY